MSAPPQITFVSQGKFSKEVCSWLCNNLCLMCGLLSTLAYSHLSPLYFFRCSLERTSHYPFSIFTTWHSLPLATISDYECWRQRWQRMIYRTRLRALYKSYCCLFTKHCCTVCSLWGLLYATEWGLKFSLERTHTPIVLLDENPLLDH